MEAEASSKDLLQRFAGSTALCDRPPLHRAAGTSEEVELSLGLSLGGCFSSNPREKLTKLVRSSSISSFPLLEPKDETFPAPAPAPLHRTCSLPVPGAVDEDYRKRKELQTLKRLEAKRKRSEKRNSLRAEDGGGGLFLRRPPVASQGSVGSSSSSGAGSNQGLDFLRFANSSEAKSSSPGGSDDNTLKKLGRRHSGMGDLERASMPDRPTSGRPPVGDSAKNKLERRHSGMGEVEEMPCVSTRGLGPGGRRVEGFLYKYKKGEEVRIVCVCHGSFLTPAEFVRHAGGGDVDHPLRHIVVNPPSPFL